MIVRGVVVMIMGPMIMVLMIVIAVVAGVGHGPMSHRGRAGSMRRASHHGFGLPGDLREAG
jgi:hypothetical protein